jgi:hypothetical protein
MSMENLWNDTDIGRQKYWENHLSQCHFWHHKPRIYWPGFAASAVNISHFIDHVPYVVSVYVLVDAACNYPTRRPWLLSALFKSQVAYNV